VKPIVVGVVAWLISMACVAVVSAVITLWVFSSSTNWHVNDRPACVTCGCGATKTGALLEQGWTPSTNDSEANDTASGARWALGAVIGWPVDAPSEPPEPVMKNEEPPLGTPTAMIPCWQPIVEMLPDPLLGGINTPTICGRLYMLEDDHPVAVNQGRLKVALYDRNPKLPMDDGKPVPLETWEFTFGTLRLVATKDRIGLGYTLKLPLNPQNSKLKAAEFEVEFVPVDAASLNMYYSGNVYFGKTSLQSWTTESDQ
jgi:hypothetical protein